jgi:lactoylglutathione lyase
MIDVSRLALPIALAVLLAFQSPAPARPKILGVAHIAVFVSDIEKARVFYRDLLGLDEAFTLPARGGSADVVFIRINDRQWIELINRPNAGEGQLDHIALYSDSADRMRDYLAGRGLKVPASAAKDRTGNKSFVVVDPDGHDVEIIEYQSGSLTAKAAGKSLSATQISKRALHVGILVGQLDKSTAFYDGILGFREFWRGNAATSQTLSWVNMRVPDGDDYIELMLYENLPPPANRGSAHHLCLEVRDVEEAVAAFNARPARAAYTRDVAIRTGFNRKRQVNLFDPDGTRVELMEPTTIDGKPAPSSTLPPPR